MRKFSEANGKRIDSIARQAMDALCTYSWPGNVRELENAVERAVVMAKQSIIAIEDLPQNLRGPDVAIGRSDRITFNVGASMADIEKEAILRTLERAKDDKKLAASILKIGFRTLYRRLKDYGLLDTPVKTG